MSEKNLIKNLTSKDIKLAQDTIKALIQGGDIEQFKELNKSSDFIFPFLKDRIINDFVTLVNKEDLKTVFEFSHIYSSDFEDLIVESWLKFADIDLTDEILELFETGSVEQKAYAAKYFSRITDTVALEYLNKEAYSSFIPLKINCAQALSAFNDKETLNQMMAVVLKTTDEFEKEQALEFINAYGGEGAIKFIVKHGINSPFSASIFANLLEFNDFDTLSEILNAHEIIEIFQIILEAYPEDISLDTIIYYQIYRFIRLIQTYKTQYANNILLIAKAKFSEFYENDIYSFDLDKNTKQELKKIVNYLNGLELSTDKMERELEEYKNDIRRFDCALEVIKEYKLPLSEKLANLLNNRSFNEQMSAKVVFVLKVLGGIGLIQRKVIEEILDPNIKALIESYIN